jgi:hypothetical protein
MQQQAVMTVEHTAADCPANQAESLDQIIITLEGVGDAVHKLSRGRASIVAQWYTRNAHRFHYLVEIDDLTIGQAEDILRDAVGLQRVTISSLPTESGPEAVARMRKRRESMNEPPGDFQ